MNKLINIFFKINFFGQKIGNKYNVKKGVINITLFEITFITSGFLIGLMGGLGVTSPLLVSLIIGVYVYLIWSFFYKRIENNIRFNTLEEEYQKSSKKLRIVYFFLMLLMLFLSFLSLLYSIKFIIYLLK